MNTGKFSWMTGLCCEVLVWCDLTQYSLSLVFFFFCVFDLFWFVLWLTFFSHEKPNKVLEKNLSSSRCAWLVWKCSTLSHVLCFLLFWEQRVCWGLWGTNTSSVGWQINSWIPKNNDMLEIPTQWSHLVFKFNKPTMNLFVLQQLSCQGKHFANFFYINCEPWLWSSTKTAQLNQYLWTPQLLKQRTSCKPIFFLLIKYTRNSKKDDLSSPPVAWQAFRQEIWVLCLWNLLLW